MQWSDEALVIGVRKHGESSVIVEAMTRDHGRHLGIVRGGRSARLRPVLQPGNSVDLVWRARLEEHLGVYAVEPRQQRAARVMASAPALHAVHHVGALLRLLPERDPHPALYETAQLIADHCDEPRVAPALVVRMELAILSELGFRLDLSCCAATGARDDLIYVSPKSGRAVSRAAGEPWRERLLPLPGFLRARDSTPTREDVRDGFRLTGYFLERDLFGPRGMQMPEARAALIASLDL
jgi:DNA repair protein RecO (recombination protein O)